MGHCSWRITRYIIINTTVEDGLEIQFNHSKGVMKEMEDTYMFTTKSPSRAQDTFTIRIDDIVERDQFSQVKHK